MTAVQTSPMAQPSRSSPALGVSCGLISKRDNRSYGTPVIPPGKWAGSVTDARSGPVPNCTGRPPARFAGQPDRGGASQGPGNGSLAGFGWSVWVVTVCLRPAELAKVGVLEVVAVFQAVTKQPVRADVRQPH